MDSALDLVMPMLRQLEEEGEVWRRHYHKSTKEYHQVVTIGDNPPKGYLVKVAEDEPLKLYTKMEFLAEYAMMSPDDICHCGHRRDQHTSRQYPGACSECNDITQCSVFAEPARVETKD